MAAALQSWREGRRQGLDQRYRAGREKTGAATRKRIPSDTAEGVQVRLYSLCIPKPRLLALQLQLDLSSRGGVKEEETR